MIKLKYLNFSLFFEQSQFLLPVMLFVYFKNGLTVNDYIFFQSITYMLYMVFSVPVGYISDHISKKHILILGYLLNVARLFLYIFWNGYIVVLIAEILMTFVRFFTTGMIDSYIFEYLKEEKQENEMLHLNGKSLMFMSFGVAVGSLFGPIIYKCFGLEMLLCVELVFSSIGTLLLFTLTKTKIYNKQSRTIQDIKKACLGIWCNSSIRWLIICNIFLYAATTVFVSTFQPLMKLSMVPVVFFGAIYFFNHIFRGIFSRITKKLVSLFGLKNLVIAGLICVVLGFLLMFLTFELRNSYFTIVSLFCICIVIGLQLANQISNINEIHKNIAQDVRATSVSIYNMLCRGFGGIMLAFYQKISFGFDNGDMGYILFALIFSLVFIILYLSKLKIDSDQQTNFD